MMNAATTLWVSIPTWIFTNKLFVQFGQFLASYLEEIPQKHRSVALEISFVFFMITIMLLLLLVSGRAPPYRGKITESEMLIIHPGLYTDPFGRI